MAGFLVAGAPQATLGGMDGQLSSACQTSFHKISDVFFIFLWGQNLLPVIDTDILPDPPVSDTLCHNAVTYCLQI